MLRLSAHIALAIALSAGFVSPASADIFKYVDGDGTIHFSNIPQTRQDERIVKENAGKTSGVEIVSRHVDRAKAAYYSSDSGPIDDCVPYAEIINQKSQKYSVDPSLVKSIIKAESNFNPLAVSPKGAKGLMQLMPATAADMGVSDILDPEQNIEGGVKYFRYLLDNFGGDLELSVAAYNCGEGRVYRNGNCVPNIPETKNYVKKVLRFTENPITGMSYSRPIYKIELKDGTIMFSDIPVPASVGLNIVQ